MTDKQVMDQGLTNERVLRDALKKLLCQVNNIEVLGEWVATDSNITSARKLRAQVDAVISECRAAIAQPEQTTEPVAWGDISPGVGFLTTNKYDAEGYSRNFYMLTPLYTHPAPVRQPLIIQEVEQILAQHNYELHGDRARFIVQMTEAAHGIAQPKDKP